MKKEDLFEAIGNADNSLLEKSEKRPGTTLRRITAIAAAVCVLTVCCFAFLPSLSPKEESPAEECGYTGHAESEEFVIYQGPVLPLMSSTETELTAERRIHYDFSPYIEHTVTEGDYSYEGIENAGIVTDTYIISNPTDHDVSAELYYPYVSSYRELAKEAPQIILDGQTVITDTFAGAYSGGFTGAYGSENFENETYNLVAANSWRVYAEILQDGKDLLAAAKNRPLSDDPITVYELSDFSAPEDAESGATIAVEFYIEKGQQLYSFNTNGLSWNDETGWIQYSAFLPRQNRERPQERILFAVSGGGFDEYTMQGYDNGSCEADVKNDAVSAKLTSYETTLADFIKECIAELCRVQASEGWENVPQELLGHSAAELLLTHGALSDHPKDRYADSPDTRLTEMINEAHSMERIFYERIEVTVPAGGSINLSASLRQNGSYDYQPKPEDSDIYGYDLLTKSNSLPITSAAASLEDHGVIEIVRQNFGFDLINDVKEVSLNPDEPRYYLEIRKKAE